MQAARSKKPIRVVFRYPCAKNLFVDSGERDVGGAPIQIKTIITELAKDPQFKVYLWVDGSVPDHKIEGVSLLPGRKPLKTRFSFFTYFLNSLRMARMVRFAASGISVFTVYVDDATASLMKKILSKGGKLVYRFASDIAVDPAGYGEGECLPFFEALKSADALITQTRRQQLLLKDLHKLESTVIPSTFPLKEIEETPVEQRKYDVVWVGQCRWYKRPWIALEIARQFPEAQFLLIMPESDSRMAVALRDQMASMHNVEFLDYVPPGEIQYYYDQAKIVLNTSLFEGYPNTLHAAAQARAAYLSLKWEDDMFSGEGKVGLCSKGDINTCIKQLEYLLANQNEILMMGYNSFRHLQKQNNIEEVQQKYQRLLRGLARDSSQI